MGFDAAGAGDTAGTGDIAVMGRYTFLMSESPDTTAVMAGLFGIKFAPGNTAAKADSGEHLDNNLQPGTGSAACLMGLSLERAVMRSTKTPPA